jgi:hypothetical protein
MAGWGEPPLEALHERQGEEVALAVATVIQSNPDLGSEGLIRMAADVAMETGINVFEEMEENPGVVEEKLDVEPDFSDDLVDRIDEIADDV